MTCNQAVDFSIGGRQLYFVISYFGIEVAGPAKHLTGQGMWRFNMTATKWPVSWLM